ncbi:hypothetical protein KAJ27_05150 [bacterium]|nr:hypothetical protein [Candidatus Neomarinimicrobiota bacterium]MCK5683481.1 hypothetical protein [bacterium]
MSKNLFVLILLLFVILGCDLFLPDDKEDKEIIKHPSEYTWTVDTINVSSVSWFDPMGFYYRNEKDIRIHGYQGIYREVVLRYNGEQWQVEKWTTPAWYISDVTEIEGTPYAIGAKMHPPIENSESFGSQPMILKYEENEWKDIFYANADTQTRSYLFDIWGDSENNIWTGGWDGMLYHFDGSKWEDYTLPDSIWITNFSGKNSSELYATAYYYLGGIESGYILKWADSSWIIDNHFKDIHSDYEKRPFGNMDMYVGDKYMFSCGRGVYIKPKEQTEWEKSDEAKWTLFFDMDGSSDNNVYAVGFSSVMVYWDGENFIDCWNLWDAEKIPYCVFQKVWTDGRQVYIVGRAYDYSKIYVIHGE